MVRAVRAVSSEIGRDPGDFVLFAFGGSGPVHCTALAREAKVPHVVVPPAPGVFSALGLLVSTVEHQYVQTFWRDFESADPAAIDGHFQRLGSEALETLQGEGFSVEQTTIQRFVDLRYPGQTSEITIEVPDGDMSAELFGVLAEAFHREHENTYGHRSQEGEKVEIVNVRLRARGLSDDEFTPGLLAAAGARPGRGAADRAASRSAYFGEAHGWTEAPLIERGRSRRHATRGTVDRRRVRHDGGGTPRRGGLRRRSQQHPHRHPPGTVESDPCPGTNVIPSRSSC